MRALILAAGRGDRMRPLTDSTPKPLLEVGGRRLVEWHLDALARAGVREVVINTAWLAEQFPRALGDGARYGVRIRYSHEGAQALETGGGALHAMPMLGEDPFLVVNGDVWCALDFASLLRAPAGLAHLVLVPNPDHHVRGDFVLQADGQVSDPLAGGHESTARLTYSGIAVIHPALFERWREAVPDEPGAALDPPRFSLVPLLRRSMRRGLVSGERLAGRWTDVGTPQRLAELDAALRRDRA